VRYASARPGFAREDASDLCLIPGGESATPLPFPVFWDALAREKLRQRERVALVVALVVQGVRARAR
jgi:hypothetical protein